VFIEAKDDGGGGDNRSYKSCNVPVKSNIQFFYRPDALPVAQPTVSEHWRETANLLYMLFYWIFN